MVDLGIRLIDIILCTNMENIPGDLMSISGT